MPPQRSFSSRGRSEFLSQYVNSNNNSSHNNSSSSSNSNSSNSNSNNNNSSSSNNNNNNSSSSNNNNSSSSSNSSSSNSDNSSRNSSNSNNNNRDNDNNNNDGTFFTRVSGWASSISASSMVRYLILIFLVGLVSVLYFATTHQVLKPSGTGPSITTEEYLIYPNSSSDLDNFPSGTDLPQQEYDKDKVTHINADYYLSKDYMRGELYDRGDGCARYNPFDNPTNVTPPNAINAIPLPQRIKSYKIGLITYTGNSCSIEDRVQNSQDDNDTGVIIIKDMGSFSTVNISKNTVIPIFSIELDDIAIGIKQELRNLLASYSARNKTDDPYKVLRVTLKPYQPLFVNSWLFAMFAVGGILVASFFVSILIHMRLYRMRRNQQEELRRQREADDTLGMKKWTLEKDVVNSFRVIIYKKKKKNNNDSSDGDNGDDRNTGNDNGNNDSSVVDNNGNNDDDDGDGNDKNNNDNSNDKDNNNSTVTGSTALIHRTTSVKSTRSTRSVRSTRSINAISNATDLYNSNNSNDDDDNNNKKHQSKRGSVTSIKEPSSSIDKVVVVKIDNDNDDVDDEEGCSSSNVDANANSNDQSMTKENRERLSNDDGNHDNEDDENDDDLNCAICLEDFDNGDEIRELPCKHWFHVECIDPWLINKSSSCPLCKKDCRPNSVDVVVSSEDELGGENDHNPSSRRTQNDNDDTNDNHNETSGSNSDTASNNNNNGNGTNLFGKIERLLGSKVRNRTTEEGHTNNGNNNSEDLELRSITRIL